MGETQVKAFSRMSLSLALAGALSGAAFAHAKLVSAEPKAGGVAEGQPGSIDLNFSEAVSGKLTQAVVTDASGKTVASSSTLDKSGKAMMVMFKAPLTAGDYKVAWRAVSSDDGHPSTGAYSFTVK
jgi:methionine-rich copper-binding protein CopC